MNAALPSPSGMFIAPVPANIPAAQPKQRRNGRKSMSRRSGQNGTIVVQSGFYRVRWRMDTEGQEERINMTAKVAPVVLEKEGKPKPPSPEVRRKAKEIVGESGANSSNTSTALFLVKERFESKRKSICGG